MEDQDVASQATASHSRPNSSHQDDDGNDDPNRKKQNIRKRTKTGCLTQLTQQACRKRRIKCDEGRPTCNNCIKSKRQCEGYSQRVIFKDPMGAIQGGPFGPALYPSSAHLLSHLQAKSSSQGSLAMIAPKPSNVQYPGSQSFPYGSYSQPIPLPQPPPPTYNFNQSPTDSNPFSQSNPYIVQPQSQPGYAKVHQNQDQLHFGNPPNTISQDSYATTKRPSITQSAEDVQSSITKPQNTTLDYDLPEDDASMGDSDDETRDPRELLGPVVQRFTGAWDVNGARVRAFSTFAKCDVLSEYTASAQIRELKDPRMLAIFMHFIKVTGPTMSLYERHPFDHGDDEQFNPNPKGANNLWTYTFPLISFNHPGLLHAMLALAALQIAKLQKVPPTAAMKHYHLAIRRIAKNVKASSRRTQPPTLAATLLLAYFEVWSSDHDKWCNHLFGARILLREIPLKEMTRQCLPAKRFKQEQRDAENQNHFAPFFHGLNMNARSELLILDYQLLTAITGQHVTPEQYNLGEDQPFQAGVEHTTDRDIEQYENLRDLYWWYCKMDVYQSILGGTKLFMEYEHWTQCPPRSPISRLDAIYGTYDHLMLLLGRLANFCSKDQSRKRRASRGKFGPQGSGSPPPFPGMLPTAGKVKPPMGFTPPRDPSPQSDILEDPDPEASFQSALQEWEAIRLAFDAFETQLGPEFQPLRPEYSDRRDSPFGMTLQYRTFSVAGLWMNFYMGMIHLYRAHPKMPPAAMQAAGLSARQTAGFANQVGRVAAGLSDDCSQVTEISTLVSAAFIESCFCLFVAGIQYQNDAQRHWLIRRMYDIARLTGWQSAKQIADGCESGWIKAAQIGHGPPYIRAPDLGMDVPTSVWQNPRRIDRKLRELEPDEEKPLVLAKSERAYYALGLIGVEHDLEVLDLKDDG